MAPSLFRLEFKRFIELIQCDGLCNLSLSRVWDLLKLEFSSWPFNIKSCALALGNGGDADELELFIV